MSTPLPLNYRLATPDDLDGIVQTFLACWRGSYAAVLPKRLVEAMTDDGAIRLWTRVLGEADGVDVLVAELQEVPESKGASGNESGSGKAAASSIVGVARFALGPSGASGASGPPGASGPSGQGKIHSLYVAPQAQGQGVGARLLTMASESLSSAGSVTAQLWVFEANAPSVRFYRHHGWLPDGGTRVQAEFGEPEIRLSRVLAGVPDASVTDPTGRVLT